MTSPAPLHIVSGKGGVGKTSVSLALAWALAERGRKVLVCEVEARNGLTEVAEADAVPPGAERHLADVGRGRVTLLSVDPRHALEDYLATFGLGIASRVLDKVGFVDFATDLAPGLRDVLLFGKVYQAARRRAKGQPGSPDVVILDAPPTGRLHTFLTAGDAIADLTKVGPVRSQADSIMALLRGPGTVVHLVSTPNELAAVETDSAIGQLAAQGIRVGRLIVNQVEAPLPTGVVHGSSLAELLTRDTAAARHQEYWRSVLADTARTRKLGEPVTLPALATEVGRANLQVLSAALASQWEAS